MPTLLSVWLRQGVRRMLTPNTTFNRFSSTYENRIKKLNQLQTNASVLQAIAERGKASHVEQYANVDATEKYLIRSGVTLEKLDKLSIIHVSGTKGKGSTCALTESILREHGYKTGFYSSPHLVTVQERIRINGRPISQKLFGEYFDSVYKAISTKKDNDRDMPAYFKFLTVMAFNVFLQENVDVAIIEVGIGGEYDCTNIIRQPSVVGITSLGIDHTSVLGETIEEIAWQKAGIIKPGASAFTVPQPTSSALSVLNEKAAKRQCRLKVVPSLSSYTWNENNDFLNRLNSVQAQNLSLALQLSKEWMRLESPFVERETIEVSDLDVEEEVEEATPFHLSEKMIEGVKKCSWPGRTQILPRENVYFFLDGAHTIESLSYCTRWFQESSDNLRQSTSTPRIIIFNATGDRNSEELLKILSNLNIDLIIFTTNFLETRMEDDSDSTNYNVTIQQQTKRAVRHQAIWKQIQDKKVQNNGESIRSEVALCVSDALSYVNELATNNAKPHVLVTGSLHLVGCVLSVLDPKLEEAVTHNVRDLKPLDSVYEGIKASL